MVKYSCELPTVLKRNQGTRDISRRGFSSEGIKNVLLFELQLTALLKNFDQIMKRIFYAYSNLSGNMRFNCLFSLCTHSSRMYLCCQTQDSLLFHRVINPRMMLFLLQAKIFGVSGTPGNPPKYAPETLYELMSLIVIASSFCMPICVSYW